MLSDYPAAATPGPAPENRAFVQALAHEALADGKVSRTERAELLSVADLLAVDAKVVPTLLDQAESARHARLSANLLRLPASCQLGEPLHVGDKVAFTGCDDAIRDQLEQQSREARGPGQEQRVPEDRDGRGGGSRAGSG